MATLVSNPKYLSPRSCLLIYNSDIWRARAGAYVRYLPEGQNGGVANYGGSRWPFEDICKYSICTLLDRVKIS